MAVGADRRRTAGIPGRRRLKPPAPPGTPWPLSGRAQDVVAEVARGGEAAGFRHELQAEVRGSDDVDCLVTTELMQALHGRQPAQADEVAAEVRIRDAHLPGQLGHRQALRRALLQVPFELPDVDLGRRCDPALPRPSEQDVELPEQQREHLLAVFLARSPFIDHRPDGVPQGLPGAFVDHRGPHPAHHPAQLEVVTGPRLCRYLAVHDLGRNHQENPRPDLRHPVADPAPDPSLEVVDHLPRRMGVERFVDALVVSVSPGRQDAQARRLRITHARWRIVH